MEWDSLLLIVVDFTVYYPDTGEEEVCKNWQKNEPIYHLNEVDLFFYN
jgi:hypothetical protein